MTRVHQDLPGVTRVHLGTAGRDKSPSGDLPGRDKSPSGIGPAVTRVPGICRACALVILSEGKDPGRYSARADRCAQDDKGLPGPTRAWQGRIWDLRGRDADLSGICPEPLLSS